VIPRAGNIGRATEGPPAKVQREPFHQQLGLREDRVAGVARFPVAWTTPNRSSAVTRQAPGSELAKDEKTERLLVHVASQVNGRDTRLTHRGPDVRKVKPLRPR
jgi:hypothetical protein